jgi:hypothetical protein
MLKVRNGLCCFLMTFVFLANLNGAIIKESKLEARNMGGLYSTIFTVGEDYNVLVGIDVTGYAYLNPSFVLKYAVYDLWGQKIAAGAGGCVVYNSSDKSRVLSVRILPEIPSGMTGWFKLKFELISRGKPFPLKSTITMAIVPADSRTGDSRKSYFGIGYSSFAATTPQMLPDFSDNTAVMLKKMGADWLKVWIKLDRLKQQNGTGFDWSKGDKLLSIAARHDLNIMGVPVGVKGADDAAKIKSWKKSIKVLAQKYKGKISSWEIWNEPNSRHFPGNRALYAELLKVAYKEIHRIDPAAIVCFGGITGVKEHWITSIVRCGSGPYMDAVAFHPYRVASAEPEKASEKASVGYGRRSLQSDIKAMKTVVDSLPPTPEGKRGRKLWITETGYSTYGLKHAPLHAPVSEIEQASLLVRKMLMSYALGVDRFFWWKIFSTTGGGMGILSVPVEGCMPKPAYAAYAVLKKMIGSAENGEYRAVSGKDIYYCKIKKAEGNLLIVWTLNKNKYFKFPVRGTNVLVVDIMGNEQQIKSENGFVKLKLTRLPIYIKGVAPSFK